MDDVFDNRGDAAMRNDPLPTQARVSPLDLATSLYKIPTLLTTYTRCGKPTCRCTRGALHGPYYALHWRDGPVQRRVYVKPGEVAAVQAALDQRRHQRAARIAALTNSLEVVRRLEALRRDIDAALHAERSKP
jgi:hypothetical protein